MQLDVKVFTFPSLIDIIYGIFYTIRAKGCVVLKVSLKDVEYVAGLSRLILSSDEKEQFAHDLNDILMYAEKLSELDTSEVEPTAHVLPINNVFREDVTKPSMDREDILKNAPETCDGCFVVPKVVD
jgi:aspartyl-tRNA(Asn)/glutamyl-tRNA(Gln) amidotransferase subunit C